MSTKLISAIKAALEGTNGKGANAKTIATVASRAIQSPITKNGVNAVLYKNATIFCRDVNDLRTWHLANTAEAPDDEESACVPIPSAIPFDTAAEQVAIIGPAQGIGAASVLVRTLAEHGIRVVPINNRDKESVSTQIVALAPLVDLTVVTPQECEDAPASPAHMVHQHAAAAQSTNALIVFGDVRAPVAAHAIKIFEMLGVPLMAPPPTGAR